MRKVKFVVGEYYHIYNRGADKRTVFTSSKDYERFLAYLSLMNDQERTRLTYDLKINEVRPRKPAKPLVAIGAYCLMPNHFHLYLTPMVNDGVSKFMQRVQTGYTMYFNRKYGRTGVLFQGAFKAEYVGHDAYAKYLFSYIHLNPAKLRDRRWKDRRVGELRAFKKYVEQYPYSSLGEYIHKEHKITTPEAFPNYFSNAGELSNHITDWFVDHQKN